MEVQFSHPPHVKTEALTLCEINKLSDSSQETFYWSHSYDCPFSQKISGFRDWIYWAWPTLSNDRNFSNIRNQIQIAIKGELWTTRAILVNLRLWHRYRKQRYQLLMWQLWTHRHASERVLPAALVAVFSRTPTDDSMLALSQTHHQLLDLMMVKNNTCNTCNYVWAANNMGRCQTELGLRNKNEEQTPITTLVDYDRHSVRLQAVSYITDKNMQ